MRALALVVVMTLSSGTVMAGPYEEAVTVFQRGDFAAALKLWLPLAAEGNTNAQYVLGMMYDDGLGVAPDSREAVQWYR